MNIATLLRRLGGGLLAFALVWAAAVLFWRDRETSPGALQAGVVLVALPLLLIGSYWLGRWWWQRRHQPDAPTATATASVTDVNSDPAALVDAPLFVLASAVHLPAGATAGEVLEALSEGKRPGLHAQLRDNAGMPIFAAEVDGLDGESLGEALASFLTDGEALESVFAAEDLRALALLEPVADELLATCLTDDADVHRDVYTLGPQRAAAAMLRVRLLLPAAWSTAAHQAAADWLLARATEAGHRAQALSVEVVPVEAPAEVWRLIDHIAQSEARLSSPAAVRDRHLLLAAFSMLGEQSIERLSGEQRLLSSQRPDGRIPGEGAAGVLLAATSHPASAEAPAPLRLHRVLLGQASQGVPTKTSVRQSSELVARALQTARQAADDVGCVLSDSDHRPSRAVELAGAVSLQFPELDPVAQCFSLGLGCGELGPVAPLALLAIAAARSEADGKAVLALSVADDQARAALVLSPLPVAVAPAAVLAAA